MVKIKRVPPKLHLYLQKQMQVERTVDGQVEKLTINKGFMVDATNIKTNTTAKDWAETAKYKWDPETRKSTCVNSDKGIMKEVDNEPFNLLEIYKIDYRAEGGRAYKVRTKEGWSFDIREPLVLDQIISKGIQRGGICKGPFIWAREGSGQLRIMAFDSREYRQALEADNTIEPKRIKTKDLELYSIYETKNGSKHMYIGRGTSPEGKTGCYKLVSWWSLYYNKSEDKKFKGETFDTYIARMRTIEMKRYAKEMQAFNDKTGIYAPSHSFWRNPCTTPPSHPHDEFIEYKTSHNLMKKIGQLREDTIKKFFNFKDPRVQNY